MTSFKASLLEGACGLLVLLAFALLCALLFGGCQMQTARSFDNGDAGREEWLAPVPVWPGGANPCDAPEPKCVKP